MTCTETLALLSYRRLSLYRASPRAIDSGEPDCARARILRTGLSPAPVAAPDGEELAGSIRRAMERFWLTIEVFIAREMIEPLLGSEDRKALSALCEAPLF